MPERPPPLPKREEKIEVGVLSTVAVEAPDALQHKGLSEVAHHLDQREANERGASERQGVRDTFQVFLCCL